LGDDPETVERARLKLAKIMLAIYRGKTKTISQLKTASLETMALLYREPSSITSPDRRQRPAI
jgi:hypothetical protein